MLIGVLGKARSGKDTFSEFLARELYNFEKRKYIIMAFATELKNRAQRDFDMSWEQLWGDEKEVPDKRYVKNGDTYWTPREILQNYGEFYRSINRNYWVDSLFEVIDDREFKNVIISDVRHIEEVAAIKDRDGIAIRVSRNNLTPIHGSQHVSETGLDDYEPDFYIDNAGSKEDLITTTKSVVRLINSSKGGFFNG